MVKIWDFVLHRDDGGIIVMHPNYKNTKIWGRVSMPEMDHEVPRTGLGGTSGKGTYKRFINKQLEHTLQFDATKGVARVNTNAKPKARAKARNKF